jgi:hypothetical protein
LSELKIDETEIEESLEVACDYLYKLQKVEDSLKSLKFNGKTLAFNKSLITPSLLGSLDRITQDTVDEEIGS